MLDFYGSFVDYEKLLNWMAGKYIYALKRLNLAIDTSKKPISV